MPHLLISFATVILLILSLPCQARDFGVLGHTWEIEEEDLMEVIQRRLGECSEEDFFAKMQKAKSYIPKPVQGIGESVEPRIYFFDPTVTVNQDICDDKGNIVVPKGVVYNPLEKIPTIATLLFFDGSNKDHVAWAERQDREAVWVLVRGNPFVLAEEKERDVKFDQGGALTRKFGIRNVPAIVEKEGYHLRISEVPSGG